MIPRTNISERHFGTELSAEGAEKEEAFGAPLNSIKSGSLSFGGRRSCVRMSMRGWNWTCSEICFYISEPQRDEQENPMRRTSPFHQTSQILEAMCAKESFPESFHSLMIWIKCFFLSYQVEIQILEVGRERFYSITFYNLIQYGIKFDDNC